MSSCFESQWNLWKPQSVLSLCMKHSQSSHGYSIAQCTTNSHNCIFSIITLITTDPSLFWWPFTHRIIAVHTQLLPKIDLSQNVLIFWKNHWTNLKKITKNIFWKSNLWFPHSSGSGPSQAASINSIQNFAKKHVSKFLNFWVFQKTCD